MNRPLLSIGIRTYNGENFIRKLLQKFKKFIEKNSLHQIIELVITDDNSKDNTFNILKLYNSKSYIRIYKNPINLGPRGNFLKTFSLARGKYFWLFDQDDDFYEDNLLKALQILQDKVDLELFIIDFAIQKNNNVFKHQRKNWNFISEVDKKLVVRKFLSGFQEGVPFGYFALHKFYSEAIKGTSWGQHADTEINFKLYLKAKRIFKFKENVYIWKQRDNSLNNTISYNKIHSLLSVPENIANYLLYINFPFSKKQIKNYLKSFYNTIIQVEIEKIVLSNLSLDEKLSYLDLIYLELKVRNWVNLEELINYRRNRYRDLISRAFYTTWKLPSSKEDYENLVSKIREIRTKFNLSLYHL